MIALVDRGRAEVAELARIGGAFLWLGTRRQLAYPLSIALSQLSTLAPVFVYFFVERLVDVQQAEVAGDYFTFVIVGLLAQRLLTTGLRGVNSELERAIGEGSLEGYLVQPVSWRALPLGFAQARIIWSLLNIVSIVFIGIVLGASFRAAGLPGALLIAVLGVAATFAIGALAGAAKVLVKGTDPVLIIYGMASTVLSGVFYPRELLPQPLYAFSYLLPDTYVIVGLRKVLMEDASGIAGPSPLTAAIGLGIFALVVVPIGLRAFERALGYARRVGVIGGY